MFSVSCIQPNVPLGSNQPIIYADEKTSEHYIRKTTTKKKIDSFLQESSEAELRRIWLRLSDPYETVSNRIGRIGFGSY